MKVSKRSVVDVVVNNVFFSLVRADVLRRQPSGRLRVYGHRLSLRGQDQQRHNWSQFQGAIVGLSGVVARRPSSDFHNAMGPVGRQGHRYRDHDQGNARVAGRDVRARGEPELGDGRGCSIGDESDGRGTVRRHRQTVDHQKSRERHKGE